MDPHARGLFFNILPLSAENRKMKYPVTVRESTSGPISQSTVAARDLGGRVKATSDTIADTYASVAAADKVKTGMALLQFVNLCKALQVTNCVFRHALDPAVDFRENGLRIDACNTAELIEHDAEQLRVIFKDEFFVVASTYERAQQ